MPTFPNKKTYVAAALYIACVVAVNVFGVDVPGFTPDPNYGGDVLGGVLVMTIRAAIGKA